ncbi:unnamed protein product [Aphanomyces euteiches]
MDNFAPSVTPRPQKTPSPRKARTLVAGGSNRGPAVSPIKVSASLSLSKQQPVEEPPMRPSKLKWEGDTHMVRNLQSHIHFGNTAVSGVGEIVQVFDGYGIRLSTDEAKALLCEYEENNDLKLSYQDFVDHFALMLRSKESGKRHAIKKTRLTEHVKHLQTFQHSAVQEMNELLKERLRDSWSTFRETLRSLDKDKSGFLPAGEFLKVLRKFNIPVTMDSLENLFLRYDANGDGIVNYAEFIAQFGASFSNSNAERVGNSILQHTAHDFSVAAVDEKVQTSFLRGQVRKLVDDKIAATWTHLRPAILQLAIDKHGFLLPDEFKRILQRFDISMTDAQFQQLLACYDTNKDGLVSAVELFNHFGEEMKFGDEPNPSSSSSPPPHKTKFVLAERTSLVMGEKINQSDLPNIKEHFSKLADSTWHAMYLDFVAADIHKTGWIPRAQFLHILGEYMGDLPQQNILSIFRSCGSHHNDLMNYRDLVKSYRPKVMGLYAPHPNKNTMNAPKQSPTEYLIMEMSIREKRAKMDLQVWKTLKNQVIAADVKRVGRVTADCFTSIVKHHMNLRDDQIAFLCLFYEDKANTHHTCAIRYSSFLTDYDTDTRAQQTLLEHFSFEEEDDMDAPPPVVAPPPPQLRRPPLDAVKEAIRLDIKSIEAALLHADPDAKGFVSRDAWLAILKDHHIKCEPSMYDQLFARYTNAHLDAIAYREVLLDFNAGLLGKPIGSGMDGGVRESLSEESSRLHNVDADIRTVEDARVILRHHLTSSPSLQRRVYKYFSLVDTAKSGQLPYVEVRRVLEKVGLPFQDPQVFTAFAKYYDVDETGMVPYLDMLHANGGKDPDKMTGMSDLASNCSYYSAISIAPKAAVAKRSKQQPVVAKDAFATNVVTRHVEEGKMAVGGHALIVEEKIKSLLTKRWKTIHKMFQQIDTDKHGVVSQASFKKGNVHPTDHRRSCHGVVVMENMGLALTFEEVLRICMKYDADNSGRINYNAFLKQHVEGKSLTFSELQKPDANLPALSPRKSKVPEEIRSVLKQKWKSIYASLRKLDASNAGRLSPQHFRHLLEWFGIALTDDVYYALLKDFDSMDDGHVNYNAFMRACLE